MFGKILELTFHIKQFELKDKDYSLEYIESKTIGNVEV